MICLIIYLNNKKVFINNIKNSNSFKLSYIYFCNNLSFTFNNYKYYHDNNYAKIYFRIQAFDSNHHLIIPSDLTLYHNLHILCFIKVNDSVKIYSLPNIEEDKFFKCIEFFKNHEIIKVGIIIYKTSQTREIEKYFFAFNISSNIFNKKHKDESIFDCSEISKEYNYIISQIQNNSKFISAKKLKKLYISKPICSLKRNVVNKDNQWNFLNLFNEYFCFCKGLDCLKISIYRKCKYFYYLYLIDINKNIYKKTDFLLFDFILKNYSSDDVYPIFEKMINKKLNAHYLTEKEEIFEKYCSNKKICDSIILAKNIGYKINDDFLERHFTLILKLRQVLSSVGVNINFINNLFYNIEYITYICIGHGVSYFKYYLYKEYYGSKNFDKLLIPNSEKLISMTLKYGWKEENLIKFNLPKWDKYNSMKKSLTEFGKISTESIFIMFTWREIKRHGKISNHYFNNINSLINDEKLNNILNKKNITLYFSLHHQIINYSSKFNYKYKINYIEENDIAECLSKAKLLVTDFSSVVFDIIYRRKPYILYIPDAQDRKIKKNYRVHCYKIINNFKNNDFKFQNIYFDINSTIDKIIYYIQNDFHIESKLKRFYDEFNFTSVNITNDFIKYILKL